LSGFSALVDTEIDPESGAGLITVSILGVGVSPVTGIKPSTVGVSSRFVCDGVY
jgi:hypothetical protein